MFEIFEDALMDSLKLIPFLFVTYVIMGIIERQTGDKMAKIIKNSRTVGPLWGSLLGVVPQCGFSTMASNFYAGRIITLGTLIAIYLSTSDEMLPIMISENVPVSTMLSILGMKAAIGLITGFIIDGIIRWRKGVQEFSDEDVIHEEEHGNLFVHAGIHTLKITAFIFVIAFVLNWIISIMGEERLGEFLTDVPVVGELVAGLVGLIPNCSASVVITQLFLKGIIGVGPMMSGLLVSAGVGLLVLVKENKNHAENAKIVAILYGTGVLWGILIDLLGVTI